MPEAGRRIPGKVFAPVSGIPEGAGQHRILHQGLCHRAECVILGSKKMEE